MEKEKFKEAVDPFDTKKKIAKPIFEKTYPNGNVVRVYHPSEGEELPDNYQTVAVYHSGELTLL